MAIDVTLHTLASKASYFLKPEALLKFKVSDYPHICFWTEKKWNKWKDSDAGQASTSNHSFLEDVKGQLLLAWETRVANILSNMHDLWHKFCKQKLTNASMTWKSVPLGTKKTFFASKSSSHSPSWTYVKISGRLTSWQNDTMHPISRCGLWTGLMTRLSLAVNAEWRLSQILTTLLTAQMLIWQNQPQSCSKLETQHPSLLVLGATQTMMTSTPHQLHLTYLLCHQLHSPTPVCCCL